MKNQRLGIWKSSFALGCLGALCVATQVGRTPTALALSNDQMLSHFSSVPLFGLVDANGNPLNIQLKNSNETKSFVPLFWSYGQAKAELDQLSKQSSIKIGIIPLSYDLALLNCKQIFEKKQGQCALDLNRPQLSQALAFLKDKGAVTLKDGKYFDPSGQPLVMEDLLFSIYSIQDGKPVPFRLEVTSQEGANQKSRQLTPYFLSLQDASAQLAEAQKQNATLKFGIQVISLSEYQAQLLQIPDLSKVDSVVIPDSVEVQKAVEIQNFLRRQSTTSPKAP